MILYLISYPVNWLASLAHSTQNRKNIILDLLIKNKYW